MATNRIVDLMREFKCSESEVRAIAKRFDVSVKSQLDRLDTGKARLIRAALAEWVKTGRKRAAGTHQKDSPTDDRADSQTDDQADARTAAPSAGPNRTKARAAGQVSLRERVGEVAGIKAKKLYLHEDFARWLVDDHTPSARLNRANLALRDLVVFGKTNIVKMVRGAAKGWRRSPLGGGHGMHYYLWWAPQGTPPVADLNLGKDEILLRAVRHHDDTKLALPVGDWPDDYIPLDASELVNHHDDYGFAFEGKQQEIAHSPAAVRFIKGHPGSGKTSSLWLSASLIEGKKALYLTYSPRLADEAAQYFAALGPESLAVTTRSFDDFLGSLTPPDAGSPGGGTHLHHSPFAAFRKLVTKDFRGRLGPWSGHLEELYGELHAHLLGRALPVPFDQREPAAGMLMPARAYREARARYLDGDAVKSVLALGQFIESAGRLGELFPGPVRARRALTRLEDPKDASLRRRFADLDAIIVDEVQDLTVIEAYLLVRLGAVINAHRTRDPLAFIAAGDEGQTVRPTDFDWGELANLANDNLGQPSKWELTSNVRSPRKIALVINESWAFYGSLRRQDRPSGYARAHVDEATQGNVIYTRCRDLAEFAAFAQDFDALPNAVLLYPDHSIPARYQAESRLEHVLMTSRQAKGLGFQTVGVIAPSRIIDRSRALVANEHRQDHLSELWGRRLIDHLRVALSRATENLLLIDIGPSDTTPAAALALCDSIEHIEMEPTQVIDLLRRGDRDADELVAEFADEVDTWLENQPLRAYRRSSQMVALLGDPESPTSVQDQALRTRAWRLRGLAAADVLHRFDTLKPDLDADGIYRAGARAFQAIEQLDDRRGLMFLSMLRKLPGPAWKLSRETAKTLSALADMEPPIARIVRRALVAWSHLCAQGPGPDRPKWRAEFVQVFGQLTDALGEDYPQLHADYQRIQAVSAHAALGSGYHAEALTLLARLEPRDHVSEAVCHRALGDHAAAAASYEEAGELTDALACLRDIPDIDGALRIATRAGHHSLPTLHWLQRYRTLMNELSPEQATQLTRAEREMVSKQARGKANQKSQKKQR